MTIGAYQRGCIFCGATKVSKEHLFGRWLAELSQLRTNGRDRGDHTVTADVHEAPTAVPGAFARPGLAIGATSKVVCRTCNNTWMSRIENATKPVYKRVFLEGQEHVSADDAGTLARWAYLKVALLLRAYPPKQWAPPDLRAACTSELHAEWRSFRDEPSKLPCQLAAFRSTEGWWGSHNMLVSAGFRTNSQGEQEVGVAYSGHFVAGPLIIAFSNVELPKATRRRILLPSPSAATQTLRAHKTTSIAYLDRLLQTRLPATDFRQTYEVVKREARPVGPSSQ